jgi:tRNA A37 threonylcarbamoyladenosine dehydratase
MENPFVRTEKLIGSNALELLHNSHVVVFGIGGVGSHAAEALARSGVGKLTLVDHDVITPSNINRQIHALHSTIDRPKTAVMGERLLDINPNAEIYTVCERFLPEDSNWPFSYVIDAVDTVSCKLQIIMEAKKRGIPLISAMGAGNRTEPSLLKVGDIYETQGCPLAKIIRGLCRKNGIKDLKTVFSTEMPTAAEGTERRIIGSIAFIPAVAGLLMASEAVREIIKN